MPLGIALSAAGAVGIVMTTIFVSGRRSVRRGTEMVAADGGKWVVIEVIAEEPSGVRIVRIQPVATVKPT